jgi:hypothetical protein
MSVRHNPDVVVDLGVSKRQETSVLHDCMWAAGYDRGYSVRLIQNDFRPQNILNRQVVSSDHCILSFDRLFNSLYKALLVSVLYMGPYTSCT